MMFTNIKLFFNMNLLILALFLSTCEANVYLPRWFSDNMVLQANSEGISPPAFLSGITSPPGETVTVSGDVGSCKTTADKVSGHWKITLPPSTQWTNTKSMTITVQGETGPPVVAKDVLPGDVFFCSGQSNMLFSLHQALNYTAEAATLTKFPNLRFFMTARANKSMPQWDLTPQPESQCDAAIPKGVGNAPPGPPPPPAPCNEWLTAEQAMADNNTFLLSFSAVCFMTVRNIAEMHTGDRPMGLIQSAWGGSRVEAWMSAEALENAGNPVTGNVPGTKFPSNEPSVLYNGMVSPWNNFSIKAAMWYQGEANADQACQDNGTSHTDAIEYYSVAYGAMVNDWRQSKGVDFPMATVQLPPSVKAGTEPPPLYSGRPEMRIAQAISPAHPGNTTDVSGVTVTFDCGGSSNWGFDHPPNKGEMSRRIALQLLHIAYNLTETEIPLWTGPVLTQASKVSSGVLLSFTDQSSVGALQLKDVKAPNSCDDGRGGVCVPANNCTTCCDGGGAPFEVTYNNTPSRFGNWTRIARSDITLGPGASIQLKADNPSSITGVRYGWSDYVQCVLVNGLPDGIPAGPFQHYFN
eukprot:m.28504 g.28504  ORF g.28504 m.28504 type:complete len:580 (+) comp8006_c0_seq3:35-1774(+)